MEPFEAAKNARLPIHEAEADSSFHRRFLLLEVEVGDEIDGESHRLRFAADLRRQEYMEQTGIHVLRFNDLAVKKDIGNVLSSIEGWIRKNERQPPDPLC